MIADRGHPFDAPRTSAASLSPPFLKSTGDQLPYSRQNRDHAGVGSTAHDSNFPVNSLHGRWRMIGSTESVVIVSLFVGE
jgi:hypothetical protein